ncbi:MAG: hypothetical protein J7M27_11965, partial [Candidatus Latescibacteria bacterium]|nr:hypothetical protein [Candidatus Latescibacterota bacterium]
MRRILEIFLFVVLPVVVGVVNILSCGAASALSTWVAGEEEHPWGKTGTPWALDLMTKQGWIQPEYADSTTNLVPGLTKRGGTAWSPQWYGGYLGVVADGDSTTAWNMVPYAASHPVRGVSLLIDLGVIFPLNRITLFTGEGDEANVNILTGYEIYVNDGDPKNTIAGEPNYTFLARDTENEEAEIDVRFRTQFVRYIKLMVASDYGFVISEVGAYGSGYAPMARYRSDPIDLGSPANFGRIELSAQVDPKAKILLRTRTGSTPDPYIYYGKTGVGGEEAPVSK